jgi:polysaccharide export outer membrane protein
MELITYLVNEEGKIAFPQLGDLQVGGLTVEEVTVVIQKGVNRYLEGASIFVKLVNRSITVMGEVIQPGQKLMVKNQLTIFEALGAAGGLNDWGNRKNIKLVRETPAGKLVGEINLLDPGVINSPYYYIVPHDVIVVEPDKKVYGAKTLPWAAPLGVATSLVSIALSIVTLFRL